MIGDKTFIKRGNNEKNIGNGSRYDFVRMRVRAKQSAC